MGHDASQPVQTCTCVCHLLRTLQLIRVLGRRCPEAQEQQQLRAVARRSGAARRRKAPQARGLRTARGTAEAGAPG